MQILWGVLYAASSSHARCKQIAEEIFIGRCSCLVLASSHACSTSSVYDTVTFLRPFRVSGHCGLLQACAWMTMVWPQVAISDRLSWTAKPSQEMTAQIEIRHPPPRWKPAQKWQSAAQTRRCLSRLGGRAADRIYVNMRQHGSQPRLAWTGQIHELCLCRVSQQRGCEEALNSTQHAPNTGKMQLSKCYV